MAISKTTFEQQVLAHLGRLHGVARRLAGNDTDAEDLVAEAVAKAWRSRASLDHEEAFCAWIFRILRNAFIDECRRRGGQPKLDSLECEEVGDGEAPFSIFEQMHQPFLLWYSNPEQEFLDKLLREDLERALMSLPEAHRIVVILSDLEDFTYAEIAATLDVPVGTVRSRLARARGALQKILWEQARERGLGQASDRGVAHEPGGTESGERR
jgi:RNA polymerase sigma-70 factor (ECF subfamily)